MSGHAHTPPFPPGYKQSALERAFLKRRNEIGMPFVTHFARRSRGVPSGSSLSAVSTRDATPILVVIGT
jgi:hypothetical protein